MNPPSHITTTDGFIVQHPSQIEKEKRETAYYLNEVWPAICGETVAPDLTPEEQTP